MPGSQASLHGSVIGFGNAIESQCQKRKLELTFADFDHNMEQEKDEQLWSQEVSGPKRQCLWSSDGLLHSNPLHSQGRSTPLDTEILPGCLKNTSPVVNFSSSSSSLLSSCSVSSGPHQESNGVASDVASAVSFSSAALMSSMFSFSATSFSSPSNLSSIESQASRSPPPSLGDIFKCCLRQRQLEQELGIVGNPCVPQAVYDINSNCPNQDIHQMSDTSMLEAHIKEANNNNYCSNNNNGSMDSSHQLAPTETSEDAMDAQMAMDSDFVPDMAQYASLPSTPTSSSSSSLSSSKPVSTPQQRTLCPDERRCGFFTCGGLRPSPVTGRLHCLCSASWRGMYGMEAAYMTDYY